jgi:tRNA(Ile)-lysidine synthase
LPLIPDDRENHDVAVALSGGPDSMALCHQLSAASRARVHALTVDHGLRPESADEAQKVAAWVKDWPNVTHHILTWAGEKPDTRIMETARAARYDLMAAYCREHGIADLYLAHHQNDQAETFLIRLAKGSGLDGLAGMSAAQNRDGLVLRRPLLGMPKSELIAYCEAHGVPFVNDPSNEKMDYLRPRLRAARDVLDAEGLTSKRLSVTAARLSRARAALEFYTDSFWRDHVSETNGGIKVSLAALTAVPSEVALRVVLRSLSRFRPEEDYAPRMERVEALTDDILSGGFRGATLGGCRFAISGKDQALLVIEKE